MVEDWDAMPPAAPRKPRASPAALIGGSVAAAAVVLVLIVGAAGMRRHDPATNSPLTDQQLEQAAGRFVAPQLDADNADAMNLARADTLRLRSPNAEQQIAVAAVTKGTGDCAVRVTLRVTQAEGAAEWNPAAFQLIDAEQHTMGPDAACEHGLDRQDILASGSTLTGQIGFPAFPGVWLAYAPPEMQGPILARWRLS